MRTGWRVLDSPTGGSEFEMGGYYQRLNQKNVRKKHLLWVYTQKRMHGQRLRCRRSWLQYPRNASKSFLDQCIFIFQGSRTDRQAEYSKSLVVVVDPQDSVVPDLIQAFEYSCYSTSAFPVGVQIVKLLYLPHHS